MGGTVSAKDAIPSASTIAVKASYASWSVAKVLAQAMQPPDDRSITTSCQGSCVPA